MKNNIDLNLGINTPLSYLQLEELGGVSTLLHIKAYDDVLLICDYCGKTFTRKKDILYSRFTTNIPKNKKFFCSNLCKSKSRFGEDCLIKKVECTNCGKEFKKKSSHKR